MANLFRELGVDRVVTGGQTMNPSTEDILTEVNKTPAEVVFVLPNNKNIIMAAQQCIPLSDKKVIVIPTKTVPQGITAMLSFDPASAEDVIEAEMSAAIESVHTAQITYAARDSDFDGHDIRKGEYLALMDGALLGSDADLDKVLTNDRGRRQRSRPRDRLHLLRRGRAGRRRPARGRPARRAPADGGRERRRRRPAGVLLHDLV